MAEKENKRTEFSSLGIDAALVRLFDGTGFQNTPSDCGAERFAAHKVLLEGVDFDLVYHPLKHLGFKAITSITGEVYAAFCHPQSISVVLGISARFSFENIDELFKGMTAAAKEYGYQNVSLQIVPSVTGLCISLSAIGTQKKKILAARPAPQNMDLICLGGNVGAAYMGQHVLEREKKAFMGNGSQPDLSSYKYILSAYLCPEISSGVISSMEEFKTYPSCGIFNTKGLAESVKRLAASTGFGAKIYVEKIPIASQTFQMAEEISIDALTAALNGGDDYNLIFTIPLSQHELFHKEFQNFDIIGHLCPAETGTRLVTPDGAEIEIKALGK